MIQMANPHIGTHGIWHFTTLQYLIFFIFPTFGQNDIYSKFLNSVEVWVDSSNPGKCCVHNDCVIFHSNCITSPATEQIGYTPSVLI